MPKKRNNKQNAFYLFLQDFKEKQKEQGVTYASHAEASAAADPAWRNASNQTRAKYEAKAKYEKEKRNVPIQKFTSTGVPLSAIQQQQTEIQEAIATECTDIQVYIKKLALDKSILSDFFYLIDVNYYCKTSTKYVIAEITVLRFSLTFGFRDFYHELVNPGEIPIGYASDVKEGSMALGLDMPDETSIPSNYMQILANIVDYLMSENPRMKTLPPLFTMPDKVLPVQDFISQMCQKSGEQEVLFRIYKLDTLFFHLINTIKTNSNEGFPRESLALVQLKKDPFKYNPGLGCKVHEENDKAVECTTSRSKRWVYTIMDSCCPILNLEVVPGRHVPEEFDMEAIAKFKASRRELGGPFHLGFGEWRPSSSNTTVYETFHERSLNSTASSLTDPERKEKRTHKPLRMPQADYSRNICQAPDLNEEFPSLNLGAGRGRGLAAGYRKGAARK